MSTIGWYYLHTNGELIYKRETDGSTVADIRESDFARAVWPCDPEDREAAWTVLVEGLAAGANKERVMELAAKWGCNDNDAEHYANRVDCKLSLDGDMWCATRSDFRDLAVDHAGFGKTKLEAISELAKELGYKPSKMWGNSFKQLLNVHRGAL